MEQTYENKGAQLLDPNVELPLFRNLSSSHVTKCLRKKIQVLTYVININFKSNF